MLQELTSVFWNDGTTQRVLPKEFSERRRDALLVAAAGFCPLELSALSDRTWGFKTYPNSFGLRWTIGSARRDAITYHDPYQGSRGSQASYWLVDTPAPDVLLLVQHLPPHGTTSIHWHGPEAERFYPLLGSCTVCAGPLGEHRIARKETEQALCRAPDTLHPGFLVPPGMAHQVRNDTDEPALNLIRIAPTRACRLQELNHHYVEWS